PQPAALTTTFPSLPEKASMLRRASSRARCPSPACACRAPQQVCSSGTLTTCPSRSRRRTVARSVAPKDSRMMHPAKTLTSAPSRSTPRNGAPSAGAARAAAQPSRPGNRAARRARPSRAPMSTIRAARARRRGRATVSSAVRANAPPSSRSRRTSRAPSMIRPNGTPDGHAVSHARQTRHASRCPTVVSLGAAGVAMTVRISWMRPRGESASSPSTRYVGQSLRQSPHETPIVPRGAGTGQTGGAIAPEGGIVISFARMRKIIEIDRRNLQAMVEPGLVYFDFQNALADHGLFFPPDPGSGRACTLGGMAANNASGPHAVRWGTTSAYVLGAEIVLADGSVITTGGVRSKALKSSSGIDLTKLFVGSEGTLGIFTKLRLRVQPRPLARAVILAGYAALEDTVASLDDLFAAGVLPSTAELLDRSAVEAIQRWK